MIPVAAAADWRSDKRPAMSAFELLSAGPVIGRRESLFRFCPPAVSAVLIWLEVSIVEFRYIVVRNLWH